MTILNFTDLNQFKWVSFVLILALLPIRSWGKNIYVSTTGSDNNPGTKEEPVQSIFKAQELARQIAGKEAVTVILANGNYYLSQPIVFTSKDNGSAKMPVIYKAAERGKVVISGGSRLVLDWEPYKNGIYKALLNDDIEFDQLFVNGERQVMARFPNVVQGKNVFNSWELEYTNEPDFAHDPLSKERIARWGNPRGGYIHAMHSSLWGSMHWIIKGKKVDGTIEMKGGWQNNRPSEMHSRYRMVENIFEELDAPGEWFYDYNEKTLYYYPAANVDLSSATIEIARLKHLVEFEGNKANPVSFIELEGFTFRHTSRTFMETKEPLLRSDWTIYRGGAVLLNGAENCTIQNCEFDQVGGNSIFINNYNRRILIKSCYIHESGANGIAFVGDPNMVRCPLFRYGDQNYDGMDRTPGPKGDNYPADCCVEDCIITLTGRIEKQTAPVQISMSHAITVRHCSIYDVPRAGININEGTFGGHIIEYCDVFNTVLETGDHGSFNSWGRDRYWSPDIEKTSQEVAKDPKLPYLDMLGPNTIRNSRWHCDHGWDIDLDDGSTWYLIYNNVLLNGGLKLREGYYRKATNNVIINNSLHPHGWYANSGDVFVHNIVFDAYRPAIMERDIAPNGQWGARIDSNLFATNETDRVKFAVNGADANSLVGDPKFINPKRGDFRVKKDSPALKIGFENFPMDKFGVITPWLKKISKIPEIPELKTAHDEIGWETFQWQGAILKNVETRGEQSAAGLPDIGGVLIIAIPVTSKLSETQLKVGDAIVKCNNKPVRNYNDLQEAIKSDSGPYIVLRIFSNQSTKEVFIDK